MYLDELTDKFLSSFYLNNSELSEENETFIKYICSYYLNNIYLSNCYSYKGENYIFNLIKTSTTTNLNENYDKVMYKMNENYYEISYSCFNIFIKEREKDIKIDKEDMIKEIEIANEKIKQKYLFDKKIYEKVVEILKFKNDLTFNNLKFINIDQLFNEVFSVDSWSQLTFWYGFFNVSFGKINKKDKIEVGDREIDIIIDNKAMTICFLYLKII